MTSASSWTFSSAVKVGTRLKNWNTNPTRSRRYVVSSCAFSAAMSAPATTTDPPVASSIPPITFSSVVLPDPDGPRMTTNSPGATSSATPRNASTATAPVPYRFVQPDTATAGAPDRAASSAAAASSVAP